MKSRLRAKQDKSSILFTVQRKMEGAVLQMSGVLPDHTSGVGAEKASWGG